MRQRLGVLQVEVQPDQVRAIGQPLGIQQFLDHVGRFGRPLAIGQLQDQVDLLGHLGRDGPPAIRLQQVFEFIEQFVPLFEYIREIVVLAFFLEPELDALGHQQSHFVVGEGDQALGHVGEQSAGHGLDQFQQARAVGLPEHRGEGVLHHLRQLVVLGAVPGRGGDALVSQFGLARDVAPAPLGGRHAL